MSQPIGLATGILFRYSAISGAIFSVKFNHFMSFLTAISQDNSGLPFLLAFPFPVTYHLFLQLHLCSSLYMTKISYFILGQLKCFISKSEFLGLTTSPYKHLHLSDTNLSNMLFVGCLMLCSAQHCSKLSAMMKTFLIATKKLSLSCQSLEVCLSLQFFLWPSFIFIGIMMESLIHIVL